MTESSTAPAWRTVPFVPYAVVGLVHVTALLLGWSALASGSKALLMPALAVALVWAAVRTTLPIVVTLIAVLASWVGDVVVDIPGDGTFVVGLCAFLVAHLIYIVLFAGVLRVGPPRPWAIGYAVWFVAFLWVLAPHLDDLIVPVVVYGTVLGVMAVSASRGGLVLALGGGMFVASDTMLAVVKFVPGFDFPLTNAVVMIGYILAQGLIVRGVLEWVADREAGRGR